MSGLDSSSKGSSWSPSKILVPVDGSENALRALRSAITLSKNFSARLIVMNVISTPSVLVQASAGTGGADEYYIQQDEIASNFIDEAVTVCKKAGINNVQTEVVRASKSIVEEIIDLASERDVDLIVMGTRGTGGFKRFVLGSVSSGVVTHAHCNVLVVR